MPQGSAKISNCDCNGATSSVVGICSGATPVLTGCKIHGSNHGCGVCVFQGGKGELSGNEIFHNAMSGVEVFGEESELEVRTNRIHSNHGDGVLVYDSGKCTMTGNTVEKNFHAGTRAARAADSLHEARDRDAGRAGVEVRDKGAVTAQDNTVARNNFGFIIARHGSGTLEANRVLANSITVLHPPQQHQQQHHHHHQQQQQQQQQRLRTTATKQYRLHRRSSGCSSLASRASVPPNAAPPERAFPAIRNRSQRSEPTPWERFGRAMPCYRV
jgi:parallel beta-helix repeat protein